jgi:hypothetical protein
MDVSDKEMLENYLVASPSDINKPIIKKRIYNKPVILTDISYENYMNDKLELEKFKLPAIKEAIRKYKLKLAGKKSELIERLITHFKSITNVIKIQTVFRRWLVIQMNQLRGPAFKNIKVCVNESDFSTLEPLDEIPKSNFFSVTDQNNFTYGFNISSLIELLKQNYNACNPYNREKFNNKTKNDIITLYRCCFINLPNFKNENEPYTITNHNAHHIVRPIRRVLPILENSITYNQGIAIRAPLETIVNADSA